MVFFFQKKYHIHSFKNWIGRFDWFNRESDTSQVLLRRWIVHAIKLVKPVEIGLNRRKSASSLDLRINKKESEKNSEISPKNFELKPFW
jgi:hypothetical protein